MYDTTAVTSPSGLYWWLAADSLSLNNGDSVTTWNDSSGTGNNVTVNPINAPTYQTLQVNSLPCVRFNSQNAQLSQVTAVNANISKGTWFVVYKNTGSGTQPVSLISNEGGSKTMWCLALGERASSTNFRASPSGWMFITDGDSLGRPGHWAAGQQFIPNYASGSWMIRSERSAGDWHSFFLNGTIQGSSNASTSDSSMNLVSTWGGTLYVGYAPQTINSTYIGNPGFDLAEVICYGDELSDSQMDGVHLYLKNKYFTGINTSLSMYALGGSGASPTPTSISGNFPAYVSGHSSQSGSAPLYQSGKSSSNSSVQLFVGDNSISSNYYDSLDYFVGGEPFRYLSGKRNPSTLDYFYGAESYRGAKVKASTPAVTSASGSIGLFTAAASNITNSINLSTLSIGSSSGGLDLLALGGLSQNNFIPLYTQSSINISGQVPLNITGYSSYSSGIPLCVQAYNNGSGGLDLITQSAENINQSLYLSTLSIGSGSTDVPLVVKGGAFKNNSFPLYTFSSVSISGDMLGLSVLSTNTWGATVPLYTANIGTKDNWTPLYTQASFPPISGQIDLGTKGLGKARSEILMTTSGFGAKSISNSVKLTVYANEPPTKSLYTNLPMSVRGTSMQVGMNMAVSGSGQNQISNTATLFLKTRELIEPIHTSMPLMIQNNTKRVQKYVKMVVRGDGELDGGLVARDSIGLYIKRAFGEFCNLYVGGNDSLTSSIELYSRGGLSDSIPLYVGGIRGSVSNNIGLITAAASSESGSLPLYINSEGYTSRDYLNIYTRGF